MKRYNAVVGGVYDNSVMVEETNGDWVWYEDIEALESKVRDLETKIRIMRNQIIYGEYEG